MDNIKAYRRITKSIAQLVSLAKMYKCDHPMVSKKSGDTYAEISSFFAESKQPIVFAKSADMLLINGEKVEVESNLMKKFIEDFAALDVGSVEIDPAATKEELDSFVLLLCNSTKACGVDKVKKFFSEKHTEHFTPRAATFKLVQENEDIVKKGEFVKASDLPPEVLLEFSQDFKTGLVAERLKSAGKEYKHAAHNPSFIAGMTFDLMKEKSAPEDIEKILWLLADYLTDEISSVKEETANRNILGEVKKKLLSEWQKKPEKASFAQATEKTYAVIDTALQLKGLLAIYKKHKKAMGSALKKIDNILKTLPQDSQLYQKTLKGMEEPK